MRNRDQFNPNGLRKGDIIRPIQGRKSSNGYSLAYVGKAVIINEVPMGYSYKRSTLIRVEEGNENSYCGQSGKELYVYIDAFELFESAKDNYEIY